MVWRIPFMKAVFRNFFSALSNGAYLLLLLYAAVYPLAMAAHYARVAEVGPWLDLSPALCWRGEIWRLVTYAFIPNGIVDWAVGLLWMVILVGVLGRNWSSRELWTYSLITILAGALVIVVVTPGRQTGVVGNAALIFGMLAAWYQLNGGERIIVPGIGGMKVRQAVVIIAIIEGLISFVCLGWLVTLAMMIGGGAGWGYVYWRKQGLRGSSQPGKWERVRRL
jgi:membrane associated rhomboid family serine protease